MKQQQIKTQKQLEKTVAKWQKILRLQDWNIDAELVKFQDIPTGHYDSYAGIRPNYEHKTAHMYVLRPQDISDPKVDVEQIVVHELMHIHTRCLVDMPPKEGQINEEEQLNEIVSDALVNLFYKKNS